MSDDYDTTPSLLSTQDETQAAKEYYEQLKKKIDANGGLKPVLISEGLNPYNATKIIKDDEGFYTEVKNDDFRNNIAFISSTSDELSLLALQWCVYYHNLSLIPHAFVVNNQSEDSSVVTLSDTVFASTASRQTELIVQKLEEYRWKHATHLGVDASSLPLSAPDATLSSRIILEHPPVATCATSASIQSAIDTLKPVCVVVLGDADAQVSAATVLRPKVGAEGIESLVLTLPDLLAAML